MRFAAGIPHQIEHRFKRDAVGRLIGKYTPDGTTAYQYDEADNRLKVGFKADSLLPEAEPELISFSYDIMGNLLSETTAQGVLQHQYDKLSNRIAVTLPQRSVLGNPAIRCCGQPAGQKTRRRRKQSEPDPL